MIVTTFRHKQSTHFDMNYQNRSGESKLLKKNVASFTVIISPKLINEYRQSELYRFFKSKCWNAGLCIKKNKNLDISGSTLQ